MASIRANNGKLFWDFRFKGQRCREYTLLNDTAENRRTMNKVLRKIEAEIEAGTFDYRKTFPTSKHAALFDDATPTFAQSTAVSVVEVPDQINAGPKLREFAETWFGEQSIAWRRTYIKTVRQTLDKYLIPTFGERAVGSIRREDILQFRSTLAKVRGRKAGSTLSPRRINAITLVLRQILNEAADRFYFTTPAIRIKPLKIRRSDVKPFSLDEVQLILREVRADFRNYFSVRFFTGMRTGEVDGLKWKYIDFARRLILVRETLTAGEQEADAKTHDSLRDIQMSPPVFEALRNQYQATGKLSDYVFCNREGFPLDCNNVTKRVWYPLLKHLSLEVRNPYQTRHTAATLWLASGESPEWIAKQMGHVNTMMLFNVYSRYVPNLTRRDGSAFERMLLQNGATSVPGAERASHSANHATTSTSFFAGENHASN